MRPFLTAAWCDLAMLNYEADPGVLRPLLPAGTELDAFAGAPSVSIVGFRFLDTRVLGVRVPLHSRFEEVNLRFYVRRRVGTEWRRGVVFVRELVPRRVIAWTARLLYDEPYRRLPMRHEIRRRVDGAPAALRYEWRRGGEWERLAVETEGDARPIEPGSSEEFITERHWGYTRRRDGSTLEYRVEHRPWRTWSVRDPTLACDARALYGEAFAAMLATAPNTAFVADGSAVVVHRPATIVTAS